MIRKLTAAALSLALAASLGLAAPAAQAHGYHSTQKPGVCAYVDKDGDGVCDSCGRQHTAVCRPKSRGCGSGHCGAGRRAWRCR